MHVYHQTTMETKNTHFNLSGLLGLILEKRKLVTNAKTGTPHLSRDPAVFLL